MSFRFGWDEEKDRLNQNKQGAAFHEAKTTFGNPLALGIGDPDHSEAEDRWIEIGLSDERRLLVVWYTEQSGSIRIIGSREVTAKERRDYEGDPFHGVREMRPEYDFSAGERGKHAKSYTVGHNVRIQKAEGVVLLDPDLRERFPDSESVNKALRSLSSKGVDNA